MCGVCTDVRGCVWVYTVHGCVQVYVGIHGCFWDEFSEYLLETKVLTSADFNTYPIRFFFFFYRLFKWSKISV